MAVALTDFILIAAVVKELHDAINNFKTRGKKHDAIRTTAEKYRELFQNPAFAKLMKDIRTRLKVKHSFHQKIADRKNVKPTEKLNVLMN